MSTLQTASLRTTLILSILIAAGLGGPTLLAQSSPPNPAAAPPAKDGEESAPIPDTDAVVESETITVWGEGRRETNYTSPRSLLTQEDLAPINAPTTEDLVKYEPSVIIRQRYIGDANGTLGIRGSNMFQTARSMVYADGIPLHYFLQTQWNGSPRWSLVNKDEVGFVEVIYGPFAAEYGGNAMGGVINIETIIPTTRKLHFDVSAFNQTFDQVGFSDDTLSGGKAFFSYGDRFESTSFYAAYSGLRNDSQPMDWAFGQNRLPTGGEIPVSGSLQGTDEYENPARYYSNTGSQDTRTNQFKLKVGHDASDSWSLLFNSGYEVRDILVDRSQNYLVGADGLPVWNGSVVDDGVAFDVLGRNFTNSDLDRSSLLLGLRTNGVLTPSWFLEASVSYFDVLEDETRASLLNPADPAYTPEGTVRLFDQAGWETADVKVQTDDLAGNADLSFLTGYRYEHYDLGVANYTSPDYVGGILGELDNSSGGETRIQALFAQLRWQVSSTWDVTFGGRQEAWDSRNGYYQIRDVAENHSDRSESRFSPKFSVGYSPEGPWNFRWSSARAYRFPIVEELFQNERRTNGTSIANADLEPEDGLHHNLLIERSLRRGYARINLFTESIENTIFDQATIVDNRFIRTFLPIEEVKTDGAELIVDQSGLLDNKMLVRFNLAYTDSKIVRNSADPSFEGKFFPRMPEWRANLLVSYIFDESWEVGGGIRYASNSFGDADNADVASRVFGAQDAYTQINLRTTYNVRDSSRLHFGIDNLTNQVTYVHHPWPGRTLFLEFSQDWQ